jgi:hypothetical protein
MRIKLPLITLLLLATCYNISAQIFTYHRKGLITDSYTKSPIAQANIWNESKRQGERTDTLGRFELKASIGDTLVISAFGFEPEKIIVDGSANLNYTLKPKVYEMEEVNIWQPVTYSEFKTQFVNLKIEAQPETLAGFALHPSKQLADYERADKISSPLFLFTSPI